MTGYGDSERRDRWSGRQILHALQGDHAEGDAERRTNARRAIVTPLTVWTTESDEFDDQIGPLHTITTEVSEDGLSFLSHSFIVPASPLRITFDTISAGPPVRALSMSCIKTGAEYFRVGVRFVTAPRRTAGAEA